MTRRPPLVVVLALAALSLTVLDRTGAAGGLEAARLTARSALAPLEWGVDAGVRSVTDASAALARGRALARENVRLRQALEGSLAGATRAEALAGENRRLSELVGMPAVAGMRATPARIISAGTGRPGSTLLLDRGRDAGVERGMPVVSGGALVGRVVEAGRSRASLLPLTDLAFAAGVRLTGSGGLAVARGVGSSRGLRLDVLDPSTPLPPGEVAVTAGLRHGRFPAGLVVGRVGRGPKPPLHPIAGPARLEFVQVLDWRPEE